MKTKIFFDQRQANNYLVGSVIRIRNAPCAIDEVGRPAGRRAGDYSVSYYDIGDTNQDRMLTSLLDETVDMNPVPLGMATMLTESRGFVTAYLSRVPVRGWKVGLTIENLNQEIVGVAEGAPAVPGIISRVRRSETLAKTIRGDYKTVEEATKLMEASSQKFKYLQVIGVARKWAIDSKQNIWYRSTKTPVGKIEGKVVSLFPKYIYLKQLVEKEWTNGFTVSEYSGKTLPTRKTKRRSRDRDRNGRKPIARQN